MKELLQKGEKKVEYAELIYDLIFVYIVGRNNSLLHHTADGRLSPAMFVTYLVCTLAVIQIWNYSTYYINLYGKNDAREHIFLFGNMFLLYFIGEGTREDWAAYHTPYHIAWALILLHIALQYLLELKNEKRTPRHIRIILTLICEAALVLAAIPVYRATGLELSFVPILFGLVVASVRAKASSPSATAVDFAHLSERAMLYVVFTFGEMVIAGAGYFNGALTLSRVYFALMAFLIVTGLFLSYGTFYDRIIDRDKKCSGLWYMLVHIFILLALNNITASLEFMQDGGMELLPKIVFLIASFLLYYICLFSTLRYAKLSRKPPLHFYIKSAALAVGFTALMLLFRENMQINIALSVLLVYAVYAMICKIAGLRRA